MKNVVIIEDEPQHFAWLRRCLEQAGGLTVAAHAGDLAAAHRLVAERAQQPPDLVLLDLRLRGHSSLDLLDSMRATWPGCPVLVVSAITDEAHCLRVMRAGASGFIVKDGDDTPLLAAIEAVRKGLFMLSPAVARHMLALSRLTHRTPTPAPIPAPDAAGTDAALGDEATPQAPTPPLEVKLSARERSVLECLSEGLSYDEAAQRLGIGHSTVQSHVRNLYRKLNAKSKVSALLRARILGLFGSSH